MNDYITREIIRFVDEYQQSAGPGTSWDEPLVGFADARDPRFASLHRAVSPTHALPEHLLDGARSVVAYFIPFEKAVAAGNSGSYHASRKWALAYIETNRLITDINAHLSALLEHRGARTAVVPPTHNFDEERLMSDWSHRHVAWIAGLGTFGLHNLLITARGCCGRLGSFVTDAVCTPSVRPVFEYCLFKSKGTCGACVKNCVTGALKEDSFDRHRCYGLLLENAELFENEGLADVCGKCTCGVPCSFAIPGTTRDRDRV